MNIEYIGPYKIAKFSVNKSFIESDGSFVQIAVTYEIPPGEMNSSAGWIDYDVDSFDDPDVKEAIAIAVTQWTPDVVAAYKAHVMETYVPSPTDMSATLSYDQIDALLNEVIASDGAVN